MRNELFDFDEARELARRKTPGYKSACCLIDLYAFKEHIPDDPWEVKARLDDLQQGFLNNFLLFPDGSDYRVCCISDSIFVVREIAPDEDFEKIWSRFCGHMYALSAQSLDLEVGIGNKGLRVIISYGPLLQLSEPGYWDENEIIEVNLDDWFALTGASEAVNKCLEADRQGEESGFKNNYCWYESPDQSREYFGTKLKPIDKRFCRQPELYPRFYEKIKEDNDQKTLLEFKEWDIAE